MRILQWTLSQDRDLTGLRNPTEHVLCYCTNPVIEVLVYSASERPCTQCIPQTTDSVQHHIRTVMSQIKPELFLPCPLQFVIFNYSAIKCYISNTPTAEDASLNITRINNQSVM